MYFDNVPESPPLTYGQTVVLSPEMIVVLNASGIIILFFFIYPNPILEMAQRAALALPLL